MITEYKYIEIKTKDDRIQTFEDISNLNLNYNEIEFDTPFYKYIKHSKYHSSKNKLPGKIHHLVYGKIIIGATSINPEEFYKKENTYNFTQIHIDIGEEKFKKFSHIYNFKRHSFPDNTLINFDTVSCNSILHIQIQGTIIHTSKIIPAKLIKKPYPHFWTTIMRK